MGSFCLLKSQRIRVLGLIPLIHLPLIHLGKQAINPIKHSLGISRNSYLYPDHKQYKKNTDFIS